MQIPNVIQLLSNSHSHNNSESVGKVPRKFPAPNFVIQLKLQGTPTFLQLFISSSPVHASTYLSYQQLMLCTWVYVYSKQLLSACLSPTQTYSLIPSPPPHVQNGNESRRLSPLYHPPCRALYAPMADLRESIFRYTHPCGIGVGLT